MLTTLSDLTNYIPADLDWAAMGKFILLIAGSALLLAVLFRLIQGQRSDLNHALSSAMGILFIYAVTVVIYALDSAGLSRFLSPLPFVSFEGDYLILFSFHGAGLDAICGELLSMVILAFLVNLLDTFIPKGEKLINWYLLRFLTVLLAIPLHYGVTWAFSTFLPGTLAAYAPVILLGILAFMLLLGLLKLILGLLLTVASPILGAIYAFFFSNKIGKQLSKAVLTTVVLTALVLLLEHFGYGVFTIAEAALASYIPLIAVLLVLWYLIGHIL